MFNYRILPPLVMFLTLVFGTGAAVVAPGPAVADEPVTKAAVIMYHRFGETDFPSTNVTM